MEEELKFKVKGHSQLNVLVNKPPLEKLSDKNKHP